MFDAKYREWLKKQPEFTNMTDMFLDSYEGCVLCYCDHGCKSSLVENAAKVAAIARGAIAGLDQITLDAMAEKDPEAFAHDLNAEVWNRAKEARKPKNAPEN